MSLTDAPDASDASTTSRQTRPPGVGPSRGTPRWAGMFRRMEHVRDPAYRQVDVAICGAICEVATEADDVLPPCPTCHPDAAS